MPRDRFINFVALSRTQVLYDSDELGDGFLDDSDKKQQDFFNKLFAEADEISMLIQYTKSCVKTIKEKQSFILAAAGSEEAETKTEVDVLMSEIRLASNKIWGKLKAIEEAMSKEPAANKTLAKHRMREIQHATLTRRFVDVLQDYNACEVAYWEKCKERMWNQFEIAGRNLSTEELDEFLESGDINMFAQDIVQAPHAARQQLCEIEVRHIELKKLEASIKELHDMFIDMMLLIENQGKQILNIERNVDQTVPYIAGAAAETGKAQSYREKYYRRRRQIIIVVVVSIMLFGALIITLSIALSRQ